MATLPADVTRFGARARDAGLIKPAGPTVKKTGGCESHTVEHADGPTVRLGGNSKQRMGAGVDSLVAAPGHVYRTDSVRATRQPVAAHDARSAFAPPSKGRGAYPKLLGTLLAPVAAVPVALAMRGFRGTPSSPKTMGRVLVLLAMLSTASGWTLPRSEEAPEMAMAITGEPHGSTMDAITGEPHESPITDAVDGARDRRRLPHEGLPPPASPPPPPASPASAFSDKASLEAGLGEWCADVAAAQATHGPISSWDVSAVTDMEKLLDLLPSACKSTFDEDLNAWDVGQVTNMEVRRRPRRKPEGLGWLRGERSFATGAPTLGVRLRRRGADYVSRRERFQPAPGSVGRWQGYQHVGAPPPTRVRCQPLCVLCNRLVPSTRRAPAVAPLRLCSWARTLSISPWKRGTLARSPAWRCATAHAGGVGMVVGGRVERSTMLIRRVHALARRSPCSTPRALSISPWLRGTLDRSPTCECAAARVGRGWEALGWLRGGRSFATGAPTRPARARCGVAQAVFMHANAFNQSVEAWDVGQVTSMEVRRRPRWEPVGLG